MPSPLPALHVFAAHLEARARGGEKRVWMSQDARSALKEIIRMKPGRMVFPEKEVVAPSVPPVETVEVETPPVMEAPAAPIVEAPAEVAPAEELSKKDRLAAVAARAEASPAARALGTLRDKMVFATGNPDSPVVFVGEAPGADEEKQGEPFVGAAGQLLTKVIKAMGLERSDVYITNICKFRPVVDDGKPQGMRNRQPTGTEMNTCIEFLKEELTIIQPKVIVGLGNTAVGGLMQREVSITRIRGQWLEYQGIPFMPTFHPSHLLRKETEAPALAFKLKREHWEDILQVMERLNMKITDKQRRFFLPRDE